MANNKIQVKRTNVTGRTANVTSAGNAQYIDAGEFALNMADGILYTSNGSALIEVGANNATRSSGNSTVNVFANSTFLRIANSSTSSNLTSSSLIAGISTVNTTVIAVGSNNFMNATALDIGNTIITTTNAVFGGTIAANGGIGTSGQVLTSGAAGNVYWSTVTSGGSGTVTSVASGNGITGGPITTTGTLTAVVGSTQTLNSTGIHVNSTLSITTLTASGNVTIGAGVTANGGVGSAGQVLTSGGSGANIYWTTPTTGTVTSVATGTGLTGGPVTTTGTISLATAGAGAASYSSGISALSVDAYGRVTSVTGSAGYVTSSGVTSVASGNGITGGTITTTGTLTAVVGSTQTLNSTGIHVNSTLSITTLTTSGNVTIGAGVTANGGVGSAGQVLKSGGSGANVYWAADLNSGTVTSVASGNGIIGGTITATGTLYVDGANGISVDASGVNVLAGNSQLVSNATGVWVNQGQIDHNSLTNYVADRHIAHSGVAITAGNGLTGGGNIDASRTLDVGAGNGITVAADSIAVTEGVGLVVNTTGVHVKSNTGIVANTTGTFVNAAYIATIAANSATGSLTNTFTVGTGSYFVANGNLGIGTSAPSTKFTLNPKVIDDASFAYDSNTAYIIHQTPTATATLNDPKPTLLLARQGTGGQAFGAAAEFGLSRYENSSTNSRTRLDIRLAHGNFLAANTTVMTFRSDGSVGIGNTDPVFKLRVDGTTSLAGAVSNITTLAAGNTTLTGWISAQSAIITGGGSYTTGSIYSDANWGMLFRAAQASPTQAQYAWKSSDDVTEYLRISPTGNVGISNTAPDARLAVTGTANVSANVRIGGTTTLIANVVLGTTTITANGGVGTAGQVLTSGATGNVYWAAAAGGGYYKGGTAAVGSLAVGGQNLFRVNANTLNTSTTFVAGENAQATGPITVASGITLTVQSGARVSIV